MPSAAHQAWSVEAARALDEIETAHRAVGGAGQGRRYATLQINPAYAMLLSSHFQRFCRNLHSEAVDAIVAHADWARVGAYDVRSAARQMRLEEMNAWRNAIAHQDWEKVGGNPTLRLDLVRSWRSACNGLSWSFDAAVRERLIDVVGEAPW